MASRVLVALRVKSTPERAFDVFTGDIGVWWRRNGIFDFVPGMSGTLAFEPGVGGGFTETFADGRVLVIGHVSAWDPPTLLAFTWRPASFADDQSTEVQVRFEPVGNETRVTVEHTGWDTIARRHVARHDFPDEVFLLRLGEWWRTLLQEMAARALAEGG